MRESIREGEKEVVHIIIYIFIYATLCIVLSLSPLLRSSYKTLTTRKGRGEIKENLHKTRARHTHNTTTTNKRDDDEKRERARTLTRPDPGK